jgi:hypothetical protein
MFKNRTLAALAVAGAVLIGSTGCLDLDITNTQQPDRERALAEPSDVEALTAGAFNILHNTLYNRWDVTGFWIVYGPEGTSTDPWWSLVSATAEPRESFDNAAAVANFTGPRPPRHVWQDLHRIASNVHDGLRAIRVEGMRFVDEDGVDHTPRAEAFAKFVQGWVWGYMAMLFDQAVLIPESEPLAGEIRQQSIDALTPYPEAREMAVAALEEAIALANQHTFTFPNFPDSRLWFGTPAPLTGQQFIQLANTLAARILVYNARSPQERDQVDWQRVLQFTANGLTSDFETVLQSGYRNAQLRWGTEANIPGFGCCYRLDTRLIGPADVSGNYQAWISAPVSQREPIEIVTPDRRVTGAVPRSDGAYTRFRADHTGFTAGDGLWRRSHYQWARMSHALSLPAAFGPFSSGINRVVSADENRLLRAEALLRTGDLEGTAELINVTRTRSHTLRTGVTYAGLPPVTTAGVPVSGDCVPRTDAGQCGDLLVALRYERMLELANTDPFRGYADGRGFGLLPDGSWLHQPVPGDELEVLGLPEYTFGGVGTDWGAVYSPVGAGRQ